MAERLITADDLIAGGCCREGVMKSATPEWPAAFPISAALKEARSRNEIGLVRRCLELDGYGDGYGEGNGYGDGNGYGYGDGYGNGDGNGGGYDYGGGDGDGDGYGNGYGDG
jgi:hypothetical protein